MSTSISEDETTHTSESTDENVTNDTNSNEENELDENELRIIIGEIISTTSQPTIEFTLIEEETTIFNSKIGGKPYLPKDFKYPKTYEDEQQTLAFLAQINFEEFEELEDFPNKGILQFYILGNVDFGMDYDNPLNSNGFRVIYHEHIITDELLLVEPPEVTLNNVPFKKCLKLVGKKTNMIMSYNDFRMNKLIKKYASRYEVDKKELNQKLSMEEYFNKSETRIGGYGGFAQKDPRKYDNKYLDYTINIFTSESESGIMWGDSGVANFFIKKEDLLKKDFNNIFYTWDCC
ncbi:DUF1963 domain-containing protein [Entamoeba marina]